MPTLNEMASTGRLSYMAAHKKRRGVYDGLADDDARAQAAEIFKFSTDNQMPLRDAERLHALDKQPPEVAAEDWGLSVQEAARMVAAGEYEAPEEKGETRVIGKVAIGPKKEESVPWLMQMIAGGKEEGRHIIKANMWRDDPERAEALYGSDDDLINYLKTNPELSGIPALYDVTLDARRNEEINELDKMNARQRWAYFEKKGKRTTRGGLDYLGRIKNMASAPFVYLMAISPNYTIEDISRDLAKEAKGTGDFGEGRDVREDMLFGGLAGFLKNKELKGAIDRVKADQYGNPAEKAVDERTVRHNLYKIEEMQARGESIPAEILAGAVNMAQYAGEIYLMAGLAGWTPTTHLGRVGLAAEMAAMNPELANLTVQRMADKGYLDDEGKFVAVEEGQGFAKAAAKSYGEQVATYWTEQQGEVIAGWFAKAGTKYAAKLPKGLVSTIKKTQKLSKPFYNMLKKGKLDGMIPEMVEEYIDRVIKPVLMLDDQYRDMDEEYVERVAWSFVPDGRELLSQVVLFGAMPVGGTIAGFAGKAIAPKAFAEMQKPEAPKAEEGKSKDDIAEQAGQMRRNIAAEADEMEAVQQVRMDAEDAGLAVEYAAILRDAGTEAPKTAVTGALPPVEGQTEEGVDIEAPEGEKIDSGEGEEVRSTKDEGRKGETEKPAKAEKLPMPNEVSIQKQRGGLYKMFYKGRKAEVFEGERFESAMAARAVLKQRLIDQGVTEFETEEDKALRKEKRRISAAAKETAEKIKGNPLYEAAAEQVEKEQQHFRGLFYVDPQFRSEVEDVVGRIREGGTRAQASFTFDETAGGKGWDQAVMEYAAEGRDAYDVVHEEGYKWDINRFAEAVKEAVEGADTQGVDARILQEAEKTGEPYMMYLAEKYRMLAAGHSAEDVDRMTTDFAETYGLTTEELADEWVGEAPKRLHEIEKITDPAKQEAALEALAESIVAQQERADAELAAREVLRANDLEDVEVEQVEEIEEVRSTKYEGRSSEELPEYVPAEDDIPFSRTEGRPIGAAITLGERQLIKLAYGATEATGYHEGFHIVWTRKLNNQDRNILTKKYGDEEAAADAFGEYMTSRKVAGLRARSAVRAVFEKIMRVLRKVRAALTGAGYRTAEDIFGDIREGSAKGEVLSTKEGGQIRYSREKTETPEFKRWFGNSKVVDKDGSPLVVYHGTKRPDRIGTKFDKRRATSGPMPFFTEHPDIASGYAEGKEDTSLEMPDNYAPWFKAKVKGRRNPVNIDELWYYLDSDMRAQIAEKLPKVVNQDEEGNEIEGYRLSEEDYGFADKGHWEWVLGEKRGNLLAAARDIWLDSGALYGREEEFIDILRFAGIKGVEFDSPYRTHSAVLSVYLSIQNPLDTTAIKPELVEKLRQASKRKRAKPFDASDMWDKRRISGAEWMERIDEDMRDDTLHAWTSIPDWVTDVLRAEGYDGIKDLGGKKGGPEHGVWIPFAPTQIKSATGNRGTFDPEKADIRFSVSRKQLEGEMYRKAAIAAQKERLRAQIKSTAKAKVSRAKTIPGVPRKDDITGYFDNRMRRVMEAAAMMPMKRRILEIAKVKGLTGRAFGDLVKEHTGYRKFTGPYVTQRVGIEKLQSLLEAVDKARPDQIGYKRVINPKTEGQIIQLKAAMMAAGLMNEEKYAEILERETRGRAARYIDAENFITQTQARAVIDRMHDEAELMRVTESYRRARAAKKDVWSAYKQVEKQRTHTKDPARVRSIRYYMQVLGEKVDAPIYEIYNALTAESQRLAAERRRTLANLEELPGFTKIAMDKEALQRVSDYIASQSNLENKPKRPAEITPEEVILAEEIQAILKQYEVQARVGKFFEHRDQLDRMPQYLRYKEAIDKAKDIYDSKGVNALINYLKREGWGIVKSGYEPMEAVIRKVSTHRMPDIAVGKSHIKVRGIEYSKQDRSILQRLQSYMRQMDTLSYLQPKIKALVRVIDDNVEKFDEPDKVTATLSTYLDNLKHTNYEDGLAEEVLRKIYSQAITTRVLADPLKVVRNLLQNAAFSEDRRDLINPINEKLSDEDAAYLETYVQQDKVMMSDWAYVGEEPFNLPIIGQHRLGINRLTKWVQRHTLYPMSDRINRMWCFWAKINRVRRAFEGKGTLAHKMKEARFSDMQRAEQLMALNILARDGVDDMARYIAKVHTDNTHFLYAREQRSPAEQTKVGKLVFNLFVFRRAALEKAFLQMGKATAQPGQRARAGRVLIGLVVWSTLMGILWRKFTGRDDSPYSYIDFLQQNSGGLQMASIEKVEDVYNNMLGAVTGDERALAALPTAITSAADYMIPFYDMGLQAIEATTDTRNIDTRALREIRAMIDKEYEVRGSAYEMERSLVEKFQYTFAGEGVDRAKKNRKNEDSLGL